MNRTKIETCDWSWNPVTGCLHGCDYCYARKWVKRFGLYGGFDPRIHLEQLKDLQLQKPKSGEKVFVCDMGDLFGDWVLVGWIESVLRAIRTRPDVTFQLLTKNPKRYAEFELPVNVWAGTTITGLESEDEQFRRLHYLYDCAAAIKFVSYEPLLARAVRTNRTMIHWQIIGPQTQPLKQPESYWVKVLAEDGVPTFMKRKLDYEPHLEQWPEEKR